MHFTSTLVALASAVTAVSAVDGWALSLRTRQDCDTQQQTVYTRDRGVGRLACTNLSGTNATGNNMVFYANTTASSIAAYKGANCVDGDLLAVVYSGVWFPYVQFGQNVVSYKVLNNGQ